MNAVIKWRESDVRDSAMCQRQRRIIQIVPAVLGELSQAIGAALVALYNHRKAA